MTPPSKTSWLIDVTQELIETSIKADSGHCMIADAVKAAIPGAQLVSVDLQTIRFSRDGKRYIYLTPRVAQIALLRFDHGDDDLGQFRFRLSRPAQVVQSKKRRTDTMPSVSSNSRTEPREAPVKHGGKTPPLGPLLGGDKRVTTHSVEHRHGRATGRIRRFGLKGMGETS